MKIKGKELLSGDISTSTHLELLLRVAFFGHNTKVYFIDAIANYIPLIIIALLRLTLVGRTFKSKLD